MSVAGIDSATARFQAKEGMPSTMRKGGPTHKINDQDLLATLQHPDISATNRRRNTQVYIVHDIEAYMYYGEASVPGITNLVFSIPNIIVSIYMICRGCLGVGELARDGVLKLGAALTTLAHAVISLGNLLAPYIKDVAQMISNAGSTLKHFMNFGGAIIAGIEAFVKGLQILRQYSFDSNFEYRDILHTNFDFDQLKDIEKGINTWIDKITKNKPAIIAHFGKDKGAQLLAKVAKLKFESNKTKDKATKLQKEFKIAFYNKNFTTLHQKYFDVSSKDDRAYIASFGLSRQQQEKGAKALANYKLIRAYRRMPCPAVAAKVNEFVCAAHKQKEPEQDLINPDNVAEAERLFHRIETKSRHIKIAHTVAMIGLLAVATAFIIATAGIGAAPMVFAAVFWAGWTLSFAGSLMESCWVRSENDKLDLRYLLPNCLRKKWCDKSVHDRNLPARVSHIRRHLEQDASPTLAHLGNKVSQAAAG